MPSSIIAGYLWDILGIAPKRPVLNRVKKDIMKSVRNLFRVNKKKEGMKDPLIKSVRNIFRTEKNMINIFLDSEENY